MSFTQAYSSILLPFVQNYKDAKNEKAQKGWILHSPTTLLNILVHSRMSQSILWNPRPFLLFLFVPALSQFIPRSLLVHSHTIPNISTPFLIWNKNIFWSDFQAEFKYNSVIHHSDHIFGLSLNMMVLYILLITFLAEFIYNGDIHPSDHIFEAISNMLVLYIILITFLSWVQICWLLSNLLMLYIILITF